MSSQWASLNALQSTVRPPNPISAILSITTYPTSSPPRYATLPAIVIPFSISDQRIASTSCHDLIRQLSADLPPIDDLFPLITLY
ncbi:hypothetical protein, partial [Salmonella enterica]|uniref:hypothetical protein n=1 Tax=Salmonella enterica TaxID=28901 RepID=UPI00398C47DB